MNRKTTLLLILTGLASVVCPETARVQGFDEDVVYASVVAEPDSVRPGGVIRLTVNLEIDDVWHINSSQPLDEFLIPTSVALELPDDLKAGPVKYPKGKLESFAFSDKKLSVYQTRATILTDISVSDSAAPGVFEIKGSGRFQACNDEVCLPPRTLAFQVGIVVLED